MGYSSAPEEVSGGDQRVDTVSPGGPVARTSAAPAFRLFVALLAVAMLAPQHMRGAATDLLPAAGTTSNVTSTSTDPVLVGAGDISTCSNNGDEATARLLDGIAGTVFTAGDNAYESGTTSEYTNCYNPTWGRHKARTKPSPGNHEYGTSGAAGYFDYFGAAAGERGKGYYAYDLGAWRIYALNSNCAAVGGCGAGSPQEKWLRADLAANPRTCVAAYWHHPRFTSGSTHGNNTAVGPLYQALYDYQAELVIAGHEHNYERFAPQRPDGTRDDARGIRQIVVGTGGRSHYGFGTIKANSEVRNSDTYGVLKLTLHPTSYDWQFVPEAGRTFSDAGSALCHGTSGPSPSPTPSTSPTPTSGPSPTPTPTPTATPAPSPSPTSSPSPSGFDRQPSFPIRAAFYYPWFPELWTLGSKYVPSLGYYDSGDPATIQAHVRSMTYGNVDALIASWWGQNRKHEETRIPAILANARLVNPDFRTALYYEKEGSGDPTSTELRADLEYIRSRYGGHPGYLRVNGRQVIFVYNANDSSCSLVDRWKAANSTTNSYLVLKVFQGWDSCSSQPDGWHQYGPSTAYHKHIPSNPAVSGAVNISPGFWHKLDDDPPGGERPYLPRDLNRWSQSIRDMVASGAPWQLVTSFNEWGEGTSVESAAEWSSASGHGAYLDALHANGAETPTVLSADTTPPTGTVTINSGAPYTRSASVTLRLSATDSSSGSGVAFVRVRNDGGPWTPWEAFATTRAWTLNSWNGTRTVYAEFRDGAGNVSAAAADSIVLDRTAPSTTSTTQALVSNAMLGTTTAVVQLAWSATETTTGISRYHVQQSMSGRPWATVALPTTPRLTRALGHGYAYQFRVRAQDRAGNWGAWRYGPRFNVFVRQETSTAILYGGAWRRLAVVGASAGYVKFARAAGAKARRVVSGRSIALVSSRGPNRGKAAIYLDGSTRAAAVVDLYAPTTQVRRVVFARSWARWASHTIEIRLLGTRNARSWGTRVDLDALVALW